ncbi:MAG: pre-toxin TG domain-containing protein [Oculatellaceae cyanobacterium bins.114]|nr:pre-toxin TG domain-containing protein [Oculatellaceae cyanobacterium bins.114]
MEAVTKRLETLNVRAHTSGKCDAVYFVEERYLLKEEITLVQSVKNEFIKAVQAYMAEHRYDPEFYKNSAIVGLATVLEERQDIVYALRLASSQGAKVTQFDVPDTPLSAEVIAGVLECLPYIGNALSLVEAIEGRDLFCRKLSTFERAMLLTFVLIPGASRFVKAGKGAYTALRLERMYGRANWTKLIKLGELFALRNSPPVAKVLREAGILVKAEKKIPAQLAKDVDKALSTLTGKAGVAVVPPVTTATEKAVLEALGKLGAAKPVLKELDSFALKRVADAGVTKKGLSVTMAKGQLLEEFKESRTVRLLQEQFGSKALGLDVGKAKLQYYPGHLLTDSNKRKLTDGLVARVLPSKDIQQVWYGQRTPEQIKNIQGVLEILAIDEAKSGKASARDLKYIYEVSEVERAGLQSIASKRFERAKLQALKEGKPFNKTLEDAQKEVAKEYKLGELGGQARIDLERLDFFEDGTLPSIFVGDLEYLVYLKNGLRTKIFGVLPKDVPSKGIVRRLQRSVKEGGEGLNFEVLGINITQRELEELTQEVLKLANP